LLYFNLPPPTEIYTLSLHDALPIFEWVKPRRPAWMDQATYDRLPERLTVREVHVTVAAPGARTRQLVVATTLTDADLYTKDDIRSEEHTSELQSRSDLVCRLLLEKK